LPIYFHFLFAAFRSFSPPAEFIDFAFFLRQRLSSVFSSFRFHDMLSFRRCQAFAAAEAPIFSASSPGFASFRRHRLFSVTPLFRHFFLSCFRFAAIAFDFFAELISFQLRFHFTPRDAALIFAFITVPPPLHAALH
jgi:hypothetical protein